MRRIGFIPLALVTLVACNDGTTAPNRASAWNQPGSTDIRIAPATGHSSILSAGAAVTTAAGKPLTTLLFDELPFQPVDGLSFQGATFAFSIGGVPSNDANYNSFGPPPGDFVNCPCLEGNAAGTLTITFDKPTEVVEFGANVSTTIPLSTGFTVDVIGPNGKSRGVFAVATNPSPLFSGAGFSYSKNAVSQLVLTFNSGAAARFVIDNLTYHQAPR
jgi:hypothetical protein